MQKTFILNAHQYYPFAEGKLNKSLVNKVTSLLKEKHFEIKITHCQEDYDINEEISKWQWADIVFVQMPLNWMGVSWSFKKYMDDVFSQGMMGEMSAGDGRNGNDPKKNYGLGGLLEGQYMISVTANAPKEAFNNPEEKFFNGMSEDDLLKPLHLNFKWFGFSPLKTFFAYDVMKNPDVINDFVRFENHINQELIEKVQL